MAAGKLFNIVGGVIIPKEDCYIITPLKNIHDKYPDDFPKIMAYFHYMNSMRPDDNPYADVPLEQRSDQILYDLSLKIDPDDEYIRKGLKCVEEKYYTTFYGLYRGIKAMLDKVGLKLMSEEIDFSARDGNATAITRLMEKYESLRKSFKQAYKDFEEEQGEMKVRGGGNLAVDEDDDY